MLELLKGIRVVDFSHVWQGPVATLMLADLGADVIKVERPGRGDWSRAWGPFVNGVSLPFAALNRGKRSIVIDLKSDVGQAALDRLLETADVIVHNFRPGVDKKMGIDFETLHKRFPRLVHASASGWGEKGADAERGRAGHAQMAAAEGGLFSPADGGRLPEPPTVSVDHLAGMVLSNAILGGLLSRERTGKGVQVFTDLHSAALTAHVWAGGEHLNSGSLDDAEVNLTVTEKAIRHSWETSDGYIEISPVFTDNPLQLICGGLGIADLSADPRFATPVLQLENQSELVALLGARLKERTTAEWLEVLEAHGILCARIFTPQEALETPQARANGMIVEVDDPVAGRLRLIGSAVRSTAPKAPSGPPPAQGQHTEEVLSEIGLSVAQPAE
ncbi:formyl-CoA transferase/succinate--hydroxymethylglutarate CoA-transferase [Aliiruegeria haliotis]|uniref:Formyl-CoA transferase/succinate--hydroxymethylglutarate CoA-transferase n=1 Tax=Aliiruegeria haliotis TaxID=1280846 RepID=A0A2T0RMT3_9RHOB|nr:CoA transferase [Aliiruegeria haliotis]PRY22468.1 formyl-CoA transferase/succinate--hydroxymethylglutarate CoA-transferase [Aliiruegeria haliotis]